MQLGVVGLGRNAARLIGHAVNGPLEIAVSNVAPIDRNACPSAYPSNGAEAAGPAQARPQRFIEEQHGILLNGVMVRGMKRKGIMAQWPPPRGQSPPESSSPPCCRAWRSPK
jgi:hypothetical protein